MMKSSSSTSLISLMKQVTRCLVLVTLAVMAQHETSVTAHSAPEIESFGGNDQDVAPLERRMGSSSCGDCSSYDTLISGLQNTIDLSMQGLTETAEEIVFLSELKEDIDPSDTKYYEKACRRIEKEQRLLRKWSQLNYVSHNRKRFAEKQKAWCERRKAKCERRANKN